MKLGERFGEFDFHPVKPRKADFTYAGPGVSVTNTDVKFRDAEIAIIHNSDYRIVCHKVGSHDPIFASSYSLAHFFRQQLDV